mgnify:CR=1 FL=1
MRILLVFTFFSIALNFSLSANISNDKNKVRTENQSFGDNISNVFNPFAAIAALGTITESNYAGSAFFFGPSGKIWGATSNASGAPDGSATSVFLNPSDTTRYLFAKDFDNQLPCNAVITDVTFNITRRNNYTPNPPGMPVVNIQDYRVSLFMPNTISISAFNNADASVWVDGGGAFETITYSSANWGEALTPEILNDPRFGLVVQAQNTSSAGRGLAEIDAIEMVVCYDVGTSYPDPITITTVKEDACFGEGSITITASGGSGMFEYSINNGTNWQSSNSFTNLQYGNYIILVRNSDGSCETANFFCNLSGDDRLLQSGDALLACAIYPGNRVTLAIEKVQPFNNFFAQGIFGSDISPFIPEHPSEWTVEDLFGEVFSADYDEDRNIYTATTILYDLVPGGAINPIVSKINNITGAVTQLATLPGTVGAVGVEYNRDCNQLFVVNLDDGKIYTLDPNTGATITSFDPLTADNGAAGFAPLGERVMAIAYNYIEKRLYYSMWNSDSNTTGIRNTIRSVAVDPTNCTFSDDKLEFELPWTSEYGNAGSATDFSMPVTDIEFDATGTIMLLAESGFDSSVPNSDPHKSRGLKYDGSTTSWALDMTTPAGNTELLFELGEVSTGLNSRGGIDFANSGFDANDCAIDDDAFIVATADALRGADCNSIGCVYGLQYVPITGGNSMGSVLLDVGRDLSTQTKGVFGDVDIVQGCLEGLFCCPEVNTTAVDETICPTEDASDIIATTNGDSLALVYFTSMQTDSSVIYTGGTQLDVQEALGGSATLSLASLPTGTVGTYYVYVITHPTPPLDYCRPFDSFVVTVGGDFTVTINDPADQCVDGMSLMFSGTPVPSTGETGVFTSTGAGLSDDGDGTASIDPAIAGAGTYDVTYTFTDASGCALDATTSVTVNALPTVSIDDPADVCIDGTDPVFTGTPAPTPGTMGSFSASMSFGLTDNGDGTASLDPAVAMAGTHTITYTYTDINGCVNTASNDIVVNALPTVTLNDPADQCVDDATDMMFSGSPLPATGETGVYTTTAPAGLTDNNDGTAVLDLDVATPGTYDVTYTFTDSNGCINSETVSVTINPCFDYDLALVKTITSSGPYAPGSTVTFDVVISNQGGIDANNITINDTPSTGLNFVSDNTGTNSNVTNNGGGNYTITSLPSGGIPETISFEYTIDLNFMGTSISNVAQITGDDPTETDIDSDPNSDENTDDLDDGIIDDDESTVTEQVNQIYDLELSKSVLSSPPFGQNSMITYQIVISNMGSLSASNIVVEDTPGVGLNYVSDNSGTNANLTSTTNGVWTVLAIAPNTTETIEVTYQVDGTFMGSSISNDAEITADDGNDIDSDPDVGPDTDDLDDNLPDDDEDSISVTIGQVYDLELNKTVSSNGPYGPGSQITYTLTVLNSGSIDANSIEIIDTPGTGLSYVSDNASGNVVATGTPGVWVVTALGAGLSETIEVVYMVDNDFTGSSVVNNAEITIDDPTETDVDSDPDSGPDVDDLDDGLPDDDEAEITVNIGQTFDLSITKANVNPTPYNPGEDLNFVITISNDGTLPATNIEVTEFPGVELTYVSDNTATIPEINATATQGVWIIPSLPASQSVQFTAVYEIDPTYTGGTIVNVVEITEDNNDDIDSDADQDISVDDLGDGDPDDDEASIDIFVEEFDLAISKNAISPMPYMPGSNVTFEIVVTNESNTNGLFTEVTDTPDAGLIFVSDNTGTNSNVAPSGTPGVWVINSVPANSSESFEVTYQIDPNFMGNTLGNSIQITGDNNNDVDSDPDSGPDVDDLGDGELDDDEAREEIMVGQMFDLSLEKTITSSGPYEPGSTVTYQIVLFNEGSVNASNTQITDTPASGLNFVSDDSGTNANVTSLGGGLYQISAIAPMTSETINLEFVIDQNFTGTSLGNAGEITSDNGDDQDSDPDSGPDVDDLDDGEPDDDESTTEFDIIQNGEIGDFVWKDLNGNGVQEQGEPGVSGVVVTLLDCNDMLISSTVTGSMGEYIFENVPAGSYVVNFDISALGAGCEITNKGAGGSAALDSDANPDGFTDCFDLLPGELLYDIDAGLAGLGSVGNFVWFDNNGNGIQDAGEPGLPNVLVELYDQNDFLLETTVTNPSGLYIFNDLFPGSYYIKVRLTGNQVPANANVGGDDTKDSDIDESNGPGTSALFNIMAGEEDLTIDAGISTCYLVGDYVWFDYNENDRMDFFENGINGIEVQLFRFEGGSWILWDSQITGHEPGSPSNDGYYKFCAKPGTYHLKFLNPPATLVPVVPNIGGELEDSDVTGTYGAGTTNQFILNADICNIGAGFYHMGTIGDLVWLDSNANGMRESSESGVEGIVVRAINIEGSTIAETTTNSSGQYKLDYLTKNTYYLKYEVPLGMTLTEAHAGSDDTVDSDVDNSNGPNTTKFYNVNPGVYLENIDAGLSFSALPVTWKSVWGENRIAHNYIEWSVVEQSNVSHYEIERSIYNTSEFISIGKLLGDDDINSYRYEDMDINSVGIYYYRIKQYDLNGRYDYSDIISINLNNDTTKASKIDLYPNPTSSNVTLRFDLVDQAESIVVDIYDSLGRLVKENSLNERSVSNGLQMFEIDLNNFNEGIFTFKISVDNKITIKKVIVID